MSTAKAPAAPSGRICEKIVYLRQFPFKAAFTDSSGDKYRKNHHNNFTRL